MAGCGGGVDDRRAGRSKFGRDAARVGNELRRFGRLAEEVGAESTGGGSELGGRRGGRSAAGNRCRTLEKAGNRVVLGLHRGGGGRSRGWDRRQGVRKFAGYGRHAVEHVRVLVTVVMRTALEILELERLEKRVLPFASVGPSQISVRLGG